MWCRNHQRYSVSCNAWTIINQLYPADVVSLLDALVSSHREKIGPHDEVSNLTVAHVIQCLRDSAPDDAATLDYKKKFSFVCDLIDRTGNCIPETRAHGGKPSQQSSLLRHKK